MQWSCICRCSILGHHSPSHSDKCADEFLKILSSDRPMFLLPSLVLVSNKTAFLFFFSGLTFTLNEADDICPIIKFRYAATVCLRLTASTSCPNTLQKACTRVMRTYLKDEVDVRELVPVGLQQQLADWICRAAGDNGYVADSDEEQYINKNFFSF